MDASLLQHLGSSLNPDRSIRQPSEQALQQLSLQPGFTPALLQVIHGPQVHDGTIRLAASICLKNVVKEKWAEVIHEQDKENVKAKLVEAMLAVNENAVQKQLSQTIALIAKTDFPAKWPSLLPALVTHLQVSSQPSLLLGVLNTAAAIFEKYSVQSKSQQLWEEIKIVLDNFAVPYTELTKGLMSSLQVATGNKEPFLEPLLVICKLFYYLNYQDLPEFFEDNMKTWMEIFDYLIKMAEIEQHLDEDRATMTDMIKAQICDNIGLYAHKYEEEFSPYLSTFVTSIWQLLLSSITPQARHDLLASNAILFLASVADRPHYKHLFADANTIASLCEKVVVPNMQLRAEDLEMFQNNPEEFVKRDLENSDAETRRRAACDLVKGLSRHFEAEMTQIFGNYVQAMLAEYDGDKENKWMNKDAAIYLVTTLAARAKTARHGITQTNRLVNLDDFYHKQILPELTTDINHLPVIKAACIKYVLVFRNQLQPENLKQSLPLIINHLRNPSHVVHTYAASAIEKLLMLKDSSNSNKALISTADLQPLSDTLLPALFQAFELQSSKENEYVMKCIMRAFSALQENLMPYLATLLPVLTQKLQEASNNPSRPHYNHYLFETLTVSIKIVCRSQKEAVTGFEAALFPVFQAILQNDVQEFVPYIFQILSVLLEIRASNTNKEAKLNSIPPAYMELFQFLLSPLLWDRPGNITPLVRLLQAYVAIASNEITSLNKIEGLLGIFQKLVASKTNDHEGFYLLMALIEHIDPAVMTKYHGAIFTVLFTRLTSSKTTKFIKSFLVFINLFVVKQGGQKLIEVVDSIQAGMFEMVTNRLIAIETQKVSGNTERRICAAGMTTLLTQTDALSTGQYSHLFTPILQALVGLFELPQDESVPDDEHFVEIEDTVGYQSAYSQLVFAGKKPFDPLQGKIDDPKRFLAVKLAELSSKHQGLVSQRVQQMDPRAQNFLKGYLQAAGVNIV